MHKKFHLINRSLLYIVLLLSCCAPSVAVAQPDPVGTWDVTISGLVKGGGYLTFNNDNSLDGYIMIRPNPGKNTTIEFNVGFFVIDGTWRIDISNHIVGFFTGNSDPNCGPTDQLIVNSFSGTVKVGKTTTKLSMNAKTDTLNMAIAGGPAVPVPDELSGSWTAKVFKNKIVFREFFDLAPSILDLPNLYDLDGDGANYFISGCVLVFSSGNKLALQVQEGTQDSQGTFVPGGPVRNLMSTLNHKKRTAVLIGWDDNLKSVEMDIAPQ